jgi:Family of unknown function (DUF5994)
MWLRSVLVVKAAGVGYRRITAGLRGPAEMVRGWVRRFAERFDGACGIHRCYGRWSWISSCPGRVGPTGSLVNQSEDCAERVAGTSICCGGWGCGEVHRLRVAWVLTDYSSCARHPGRRRARPHHDTGCHPCRDGNVEMTLIRTTHPDHGEGPSSASRGCSLRLSLKPSGSARGALDGAWWPRSTDPVIELVALSEELGAQRAPVRRSR